MNKEIIWQLLELSSGQRSPVCLLDTRALANELKAVTPDDCLDVHGVLILMEADGDGKFHHSSLPIITVRKFVELFSSVETDEVKENG